MSRIRSLAFRTRSAACLDVRRRRCASLPTHVRCIVMSALCILARRRRKDACRARVHPSRQRNNEQLQGYLTPRRRTLADPGASYISHDAHCDIRWTLFTPSFRRPCLLRLQSVEPRLLFQMRWHIQRPLARFSCVAVVKLLLQV